LAIKQARLAIAEFYPIGRFTRMKVLTPNVRRIIASLLLAVPFGWLASRGFLPSAVRAYIGALALYWLIQACTKYQRPSDGLLVIGFLTVLYVLLLPALARARA
jgi:hypothetical protein